MPKAHAKVKTHRPSKQAKQKLVEMMRELETPAKKQSKAVLGSCRRVYCI